MGADPIPNREFDGFALGVLPDAASPVHDVVPWARGEDAAAIWHRRTSHERLNGIADQG